MMSPTLLEATIVLILVVLGWQIGVRIAPVVLTYWQAARQQLNQVESPPAEQPLPSTKKSNKESNHE
jgi:hypothetical protein